MVNDFGINLILKKVQCKVGVKLVDTSSRVPYNLNAPYGSLFSKHRTAELVMGSTDFLLGVKRW